MMWDNIKKGDRERYLPKAKTQPLKLCFWKERKKNGVISKAAGMIAVLHEKTAQSMILGDQIQVRHFLSV